MKIRIITLIVLWVGTGFCFSQGFVNLNFENATFIVDPSVPSYYPYPYAVYASNAVPGWTVAVDGNQMTDIASNTVSLSGESISIIGTNNNLGFQPIQGKYYILLASGNYPGTGVPISIGQTGTIPLGTESIEFWGDIGGLQITFDGEPLSFNEIGSTANYNIYAADISEYAGDRGQLLFTLPPYVGNAELDNIQFLSTPVPEPSEFALGALGALLLGVRRWRSRK